MTQHDMTNLRTRLRVISTTAVLLYHQITFNGQNRNLVNIKRLMNDEIQLFETEEIKFSIFDFGQFYKIRFGLNLQECSFSKILAQKWQKKWIKNRLLFWLIMPARTAMKQIKIKSFLLVPTAKKWRNFFKKIWRNPKFTIFFSVGDSRLHWYPSMILSFSCH